MPISALESYDSFCKVLDHGEKKRKLQKEGLEKAEDANKFRNLERTTTNSDGRGGDYGICSKSIKNKNESSSSKKVEEEKKAEEEEEEEKEEEEEEEADEEKAKSQEEEEEAVDEEVEDDDLKQINTIAPVRYQSDHITIAEIRPKKIDYSFMGDTSNANGSKDGKGITVRQPSIVRDLWSQVRLLKIISFYAYIIIFIFFSSFQILIILSMDLKP